MQLALNRYPCENPQWTHNTQVHWPTKTTVWANVHACLHKQTKSTVDWRTLQKEGYPQAYVDLPM